jgi:hypothetical protein
MQVLFAGHVLPHAIDVAHLLLTQELERQSRASPHRLPSGQPGEQAGVATHSPDVQIPDMQSPSAPQTFPVPHVGAHKGERQVPAVQTPDAQLPALRQP